MANVKSFKADVSSITPVSERRAEVWNISFETIYDGRFTLSAQLIKPNYLVIHSHWCKITVSLEAYPLFQGSVLLHMVFQKNFKKCIYENKQNGINTSSFWSKIGAIFFGQLRTSELRLMSSCVNVKTSKRYDSRLNDSCKKMDIGMTI